MKCLTPVCKATTRRKTTMFAAVVGVFSIALITGVATTASSQTIYYDYTTELLLSGGPDTAGLNGATVDIKADVSSSATYVNRFTFPAVVMNNDATCTITGSSQAANNGTFAMPQLAFYPTFAGVFTDPGGGDPEISLPVGGTLDFALFTNPSAVGATEVIGNTVNILDFAPATSQAQAWQLTGAGTATYNELNPVITATQSASGTPEPGGVAYIACMLVSGGVFALRRRRTL